MEMGMDDKNVLLIPKIENGIVIDHIPAGLGPKLLELLLRYPRLRSVALTLGVNYRSTRMGTKDMIKLGTRELPADAQAQISIVAPGVTVKTITDYRVGEKLVLSLPDRMIGLVKCRNPNCITNAERSVETRFTLDGSAESSIGRGKGRAEYRCAHCERVFALAELERILP